MNHDLIYRLSHDLQAPLRGISLSSGWIFEGLGDDLDSEMEGAKNALQHSVSRLERLLGGLLDLSRADRGASVDDTDGPFEPAAAFERAAGDRSDVELSVTGDAPLAGSREGFERVAQELLANAALHGESDVARVTVDVQVDGESARVVVADDGPGVDERMRDVAFELFVSRFGASSPEHVGVGLTIARATAVANGGSLDLRSDEGRGARFDLRWPVSTRRASAHE